MNTSREKTSGTPRHYSSAIAKDIGESLQRTLSAPWRLDHSARAVDVLTGTGKMTYTPDFLIKNSLTGRAVAVEVKSSMSLSIPNILKLQDVQAVLENQGTHLLIVVHGESSDESAQNDRLGDYGLNAVNVRGALHAAGEIEKQLGP